MASFSNWSRPNGSAQMSSAPKRPSDQTVAPKRPAPFFYNVAVALICVILTAVGFISLNAFIYLPGAPENHVNLS